MISVMDQASRTQPAKTTAQAKNSNALHTRKTVSWKIGPAHTLQTSWDWAQPSPAHATPSKASTTFSYCSIFLLHGEREQRPTTFVGSTNSLSTQLLTVDGCSMSQGQSTSIARFLVNKADNREAHSPSTCCDPFILRKFPFLFSFYYAIVHDDIFRSMQDTLLKFALFCLSEVNAAK